MAPRPSRWGRPLSGCGGCCARGGRARVALATDVNPGTSPATSLLECAASAVVGLSADEALLAVTYNAAAALGRAQTVRGLNLPPHGDVVVWRCEALESGLLDARGPGRDRARRG